MENFIFFLYQEERLQQMHNIRLNHRQLRDHSNPFDLPDKNFLKLFRLSKMTVHYLIEQLSPHLPRPQRNTFIPNHIKVFAALIFLGKGSYQLDVGQNYLLGLSQPSMSRCLWHVVNAINIYLLNEWIKFPTTDEQKDRIKQGFIDKCNFPGVTGVIDCTHISIIAPPATDPQFPGRVYFNRKGYSSINTQVVCDSNLKILSINARFPGSTHDAAIWATSNVKEHLHINFLNGEESTYLLGDSGYPLQPWLLTPVLNAAEGTPQAAYTQAHIYTRNCVERFNGVFKSRCRCCLRHRVLNYSPVRAAKIIYACAVLHNMSIDFHNDYLEDDALDEEENGAEYDHDNVNNNWFNEGNRIRNEVIANFFRN